MRCTFIPIKSASSKSSLAHFFRHLQLYLFWSNATITLPCSLTKFKQMKKINHMLNKSFPWNLYFFVNWWNSSTQWKMLLSLALRIYDSSLIFVYFEMLKEFFHEKIIWIGEVEVNRNFLNPKNIARYNQGLLVKSELWSHILNIVPNKYFLFPC